MVDILKKELTKDFDAAIEHVVNICEKEGFTVMLTKSIDGILKKKLGVTDFPRYTTILACGPELAKMALEASFNVGLLFPCSFVVYEENDKIYVSHASIMKIAKEVGLASAEAMDPVIEKTGKMVHKAWEQF
ncbi:MAG: DUF302 domain-containing protein [Candidatus Heimdallarchaeota archaeon]|nr:DUF302 domain-containing protein [Candidatus Heimdallarchaeota archaeon]MCK5297596.1 DUF302 domain-containing protein [Candidatus Heimdallarchaeota archaeon]